MFNMPVPYTGIDNDFNLNFIEHTGQIDWTRPINDANKFDIGSKYINRRNHSITDIEYLDFNKEHSDFSHITQVLALYFDYRFKYRKFGARAGLRYEYSRLSAEYKDGSNDPFHSNLNARRLSTCLEFDAEAGDSVGVGGEREFAAVGVEHFVDKKQSKPVSGCFCGEEWSEQHPGCLAAYPGSVIGYCQCHSRLAQFYFYVSSLSAAFRGILYDIGDSLLYQNRIKHHKSLFFRNGNLQLGSTCAAGALKHR